MLNHKLDFSSCAWKPGFVKSSHIYILCTYVFTIVAIVFRGSGGECNNSPC